MFFPELSISITSPVPVVQGDPISFEKKALKNISKNGPEMMWKSSEKRLKSVLN